MLFNHHDTVNPGLRFRMVIFLKEFSKNIKPYKCKLFVLLYHLHLVSNFFMVFPVLNRRNSYYILVHQCFLVVLLLFHEGKRFKSDTERYISYLSIVTL